MPQHRTVDSLFFRWPSSIRLLRRICPSTSVYDIALCLSKCFSHSKSVSLFFHPLLFGLMTQSCERPPWYTNSALNHQGWRNIPTLAINTSNRRCQFSIAWLNCLASAASIDVCNKHCWTNNSYYRTRLLEVVKVVILNVVFRSHVFYQPKPRFNKLGIFEKGPSNGSRSKNAGRLPRLRGLRGTWASNDMRRNIRMLAKMQLQWRQTMHR